MPETASIEARTMISAVTWPAAARVGEMDFDLLVRQHQQRVFRLLLGMVRDRDAAETLTQDCFLRAYQARHDFRGEARESTWLLRIAMNLARDHLRSRRLQFWRRISSQAEPEADLAERLADAQPAADRALIARQQLQRVWQVVERLSARQRAIFLLRFVEELELDEIAAVLEIKPATVRVHLFRAVQAVQKAVGP